ncbi:MAG: DUF2027 domain-containing protein [Candidatus Azobacteroides sp.]|nr:DUF2027 domain-containing protein [Candidatus Azobacteroides sp.]
MVKIGDKVRFLNAVGGGIVRRFQNKDIVIVEEEDGFETPILMRECIVVGENPSEFRSSFSGKVEKKEVPPVVEKPKEEKIEIAETSEGERLNVYLAYLPMDIKELGKCNYEAFLINSSNYYLFFNYMSRQNQACVSRGSESIEPHTRLFLEEFSRTQLNEMESICIQFIAFKKDKPYAMKNAFSVELRLDVSKFYKLHSFRENDFFEDDALIYPVVTNDKAVREWLISASELQEALTEKTKIDLPRRSPVPSKKEIKPSVIEVDLHIDQLLDTTAGLSNAELLNIQLDKFRQVMEENKGKKGQKIVFIHGKGEGILRNAILTELKKNYKRFPVQDASFKEYGFGATMVTIL